MAKIPKATEAEPMKKRGENIIHSVFHDLYSHMVVADIIYILAIN